MAQNGPEMILKFMGAYMHSKILLVAAKLKVFNHFGNNKLTVKEAADALEMKESYCSFLLNALYKMKFLERLKNEDGTIVYFNSTVSKEFLCEDSINYFGDLLIFQENEWDSWSKLYNTFISGEPKALDSEDMSSEELQIYMKGMNQIGRFTGKAVAASINLQNCHSILDLGCGSGIFSINFKKRNKNLKCTLIDREEVIEIARKNFQKENMDETDFTFLKGNYLMYPFVNKYDCVFISHNIHEYSSEVTLNLFQNIYQLLNDGGMLIIHDYISTESSIFPDLFSIGMLMQKQDAHCYSYKELLSMLEVTQFSEVKLVSMGNDIPSSLVIAKKQIVE
ncbi:methyltransferase domain-containing protein [Clostridium sp. SHJSY1]|uniref:class I SAM-dependent methyltransferase n=1 Tax=Clostridium sp. SHJSY1 TaxID=2942483 RepID=UPI0028763E9A|nr:class I SAM-dependent methyltransferase [Clostridium sp. SHJSY1]MDS0527085.1 methyltransferase domain-containing protein [Clostridium sp. SHJSY1]